MKLNKGKKLTKDFGLSISDVDLTKLNRRDGSRLKTLLHENKVLLFKNQKLTPHQFIQFSRLIGSPVAFVDKEYRHPQHPEIFVVSNLKNRKFGMDRVGYYWHSDSSFLKNPLPVTMLLACEVPVAGGETRFIDMNATFNRLPDRLKKKIGSLKTLHEGQWRYLVSKKDLGLSIQEILERDREYVPPTLHPLVVTHPVTKRKALYLSEGVSQAIDGLTADEGQTLLNLLWKYILRGATYTHRWEKGDLLIWDNRSVVHRAYPAKANKNRVMHRIGVRDGSFFRKGKV